MHDLITVLLELTITISFTTDCSYIHGIAPAYVKLELQLIRCLPITFELNYISLVVGTLYLNMFCFCISDICSLCQLVFFSIIRGFTIFSYVMTNAVIPSS